MQVVECATLAHSADYERADRADIIEWMRIRGSFVRRLALSSIVYVLGGCPSSNPSALLPTCNPAHGDRDCHGSLPFCRAVGGAGEHHCIACDTDRDCDDHVFCNGVERCTTLACTAGTPVDCHSSEQCPSRCNEALARCEPTESFDDDGDGHRSAACGGDDCDDADPGRFPGNTEICDSRRHDEDCDPWTYGQRDSDGDGYDDGSCCNTDGSGSLVCGDDCDDRRPDVHPALAESCDGRDNDCDGAADEGVLVASYMDADGDGWGTGPEEQICAGLDGHAVQSGDCDDANPQLHPAAFRCAGSGSAIDVCGDDGRFMEANCPNNGACVPQPDGTGVCWPGAGVACSDGIDNDGDGLIDWQDPNCASPADTTELPERCGDGIDNDGDHKIDYPYDPGCSSTEDTTENDPATLPACSNGLDDDGDGTRDFAAGSADPGCISAADDSEREAGGPACDNGVDDDMDTTQDFPADPDCTAPSDTNEATPACSNGLDDDGDGTIDFSGAPRPKPDPGADPGCASATDDSERGTPNSPACDNAIDDDGDGAADSPADLGCIGPSDTSE
jgi:hypothetical protein